MDDADDDARVRQWERRGALPLLAASAAFLASYAIQVLVPHLSPGQQVLWQTVTAVTWAAFVVDYLVRLAMSSRRGHFVKHNLLDLVVIALPLLRPLRVVAPYQRIRVQVHRSTFSLEARVMTYAGLTVLLLGFTGSLAVLQAERYAPGANIRDFGDAVWWAASTVTTTGYGDTFPVTGRGQVVGVVLMFLGVALIGAVVGSFSSWLMGRFQREGETVRVPGPGGTPGPGSAD